MKLGKSISVGILALTVATTASAQFNQKLKSKLKPAEDTEFKATGGGLGPDFSEKKRTLTTQVNAVSTFTPPGGGLLVQVSESLVDMSQSGRKSVTMIEGSDYKFKVPKGNGEYIDRTFKIGVGYSDEGIKELMKSQYSVGGNGIGGGIMGSMAPVTGSNCGPEVLYVTQQFQAEASGTYIKGYKFGDQLFAYAGAGAQGGVRTTEKGYNNWIYLGAVGEAGVGVKSGQNTVMVGAQATAGMDAKSGEAYDQNAPYAQTQPNVKGVAKVGMNARFANQNVMARAGVSGHEEQRLVANSPYGMGAYGAQSLDNVKVTDFACEVLIKMKDSNVAIGAQVSGQVVKGGATTVTSGTYAGMGALDSPYGTSDSRVNTSFNEKNVSAGFKLIYLIKGGNEKRFGKSANH